MSWKQNSIAVLTQNFNEILNSERHNLWGQNSITSLKQKVNEVFNTKVHRKCPLIKIKITFEGHKCYPKSISRLNYVLPKRVFKWMAQ